MKNKILTSLALLTFAISAVRCSKESAPAAPEKAADAPKTAPVPAPKVSTPAPAPATVAAAASSPSMAAVATPKASGVMSSGSVSAPKPTAASATNAVGSTTDRSNLDTALAEAVRLLEAKDYGNFIKEFAPPDALPPGMPPEMIDQILPAIINQPDFVKQIKQLSDTLKAITAQKITPTMSADGNSATYNTTGADGSKQPVVFTKANGVWYPDMPWR